MYGKHLDTFIQTADCGSFLKASERMFISASAITKQINLLEERLEAKLFHRSPRGLALTDAGRLIYTEAKKLIRQSNAVLRKARELEAPREYVIHIGVSLMNPINLLASSRELLLSAECWGGVHPLLATIPLDCPYTIPYGLICAKNPPREVMQFIMAVGQAGETE